MIRRNGLVCLLAGVVLAASQVAHAADFTLVVNGHSMTLSPPPLTEGSEVLLPGPTISHALGIAVFPTSTPGMWVASAYGRKIYVRANATRYLREGMEVEALHAPRVQAGQIHLPVSLLADNFGLRATSPSNQRLEFSGPGAAVQDIRQGEHPDYVRVAIDLTEPSPFRWTQDANTVTLVIPPPAGGVQKCLRQLAFAEPLVPEIIQEPAPDGGTRILIGHRCPVEAILFTMDDPARIVVDFPRRVPQVPTAPSAPEPLDYHRLQPWKTHRLAGQYGVSVAYVLTLPTGRGEARLRPALAGDSVCRSASVLRIASEAGAFAALNGGYFAIGGGPLGMVMIDGEWMKEPILGRTVLGVLKNGAVQMANVKFEGAVALPGAGTMKIEGVNRIHEDHQDCVLYTGRWGGPTAEKPGATRVMLSALGEVLLVNDQGRGMEIPKGGYVLSVLGPRAAQAAKAQRGGVARISLSTNPPWPGLVHALGGGPRLVANGRPYVTSTTERFRPDVAVGPAPRSAVGIMPNGDVVFVAVDGRQAGYSAGATLSELASFLVQLGVRDAMNFDGGGSATLVANGQLVNRPCNGSARRVSNALLAFRVARAAGGP